jgi:hypothetical protein
MPARVCRASREGLASHRALVPIQPEPRPAGGDHAVDRQPPFGQNGACNVQIFEPGSSARQRCGLITAAPQLLPAPSNEGTTSSPQSESALAGHARELRDGPQDLRPQPALLRPPRVQPAAELPMRPELFLRRGRPRRDRLGSHNRFGQRGAGVRISVDSHTAVLSRSP